MDSTPNQMDATLAAALVKAQRIVKAAEKSSTNTFHNYKYASAEEVIEVGGDALSTSGLAMMPVSEEVTMLDKALLEGAGGAAAMLRATFRLVHESGANVTFITDVPVVPERGKNSGWSRPLDKALFGARTEALSYALRDLLLIPREDAPDVSGRADRDRRRRGAEDDDGGSNGDAARADFPRMAPAETCAALDKAIRLDEATSAFQTGRAYLKQHPEEKGVFSKIESAFARAAVRIIGGYTRKVQAQKAAALLKRFTVSDELQGEINEALARAQACPP